MRRGTTQLVLALLGVLIFHPCFCQENYLPGAVITIKGDTLRGLIDYRNWNKNPDKIKFKSERISAPVVYHPLDLKEFRVSNDCYEGAIVESEVSLTDLSVVEYNDRIVTKKDTAFLQAMIRGPKSLYFYKNKDGKEQLYIKQNSEYQLLIYKKYILTEKGIDNLYENKKYLGQLCIYLHDDPFILEKLKRTKYAKKSIEKLFNDYYGYTNSETAFQKKTERLSFSWGILVGVVSTKLSFESDTHKYLEKGGYNSSTSPSFGVCFDLIFPRNQKRWAISNDIIYTSCKTNGSYKESRYKNDYTLHDAQFELSYIKLNNMLRYRYPVKKLLLFASAGMSNGYSIKNKNHQTNTTKFYTTEKIEETEALTAPKKYEFGYLAGFGASYNIFSLEMRYERGTGIAEHMNISSSTNRLYLFLGIKL